MVVLAQTNKDEKLMKQRYVQSLINMGADDKRIMVLDADLSSPIGSADFYKAYPERAFDCGIQESDMIGIAAGASEAGAIPFTHTFAAFAGRKCADQVFMAACYPGLNVKMVGADPGLTAERNGGTHQGMDDMGTLYGLPNITLIDFTDAVMLEALLPVIKETYGVYYMRLARKSTDLVYSEKTDFEIGKGLVLRDGADVTIIASGIEVAESLKAAQLLEARGVSARVVDMFTWKPLDRELIADCAKATGAIVTAENHFVDSGLGHAVAAVCAEECPVPMGFIGVKGVFGEVGSSDFLKKRFEMTAEDIAKKAQETVARKRV